ncbi:MAG TPA: hypothetical protein VD886_20485 [Herpetosiphonaceae bacterium]|nr:hypothetical protein [Herpetosiphonaceae bacterium]
MRAYFSLHPWHAVMAKLALSVPILFLCMWMFQRAVPLKTRDLVRPTVPVALRRVDAASPREFMRIGGDNRLGALLWAGRDSEAGRAENLPIVQPLRGQLEALLRRWCGLAAQPANLKQPYYEIVFLCPSSDWKIHRMYVQDADIPPPIRELERVLPPITP